MTPLDGLMIRWIRLRSRWDSARRWKNPSGSALDLGYDHIPGREEFLGGGLVKCQDLQERFGNERQHPALLYLVSSALPHDADIQLRAAKAAGAKVILNQNGVGYPGWHGPGWERFNAPMKYLHAAADVVVYQSEFCKQGALRFLGERQGASHILHNPVDCSTFVPAETAPEEGPLLLLAGTHQFQYRVDSALDCLIALKDQLPGAQLLIAGRQTWCEEEQAREHLRSRAAEAGVADRLRFLGTYLQAEAPALMQQAHLLLHSKYNDPCPRLVVEAMACGLPVVYSASGGMPELVPAEAGVGVEAPQDYEQDHPPSGEALAAAVQQLWQNYGDYRRAAREHAATHLDVQPWLDAHAQIFAELSGEGA